jgi:hypothetical protein
LPFFGILIKFRTEYVRNSFDIIFRYILCDGQV